AIGRARHRDACGFALEQQLRRCEYKTDRRPLTCTRADSGGLSIVDGEGDREVLVIREHSSGDPDGKGLQSADSSGRGTMEPNFVRYDSRCRQATSPILADRGVGGRRRTYAQAALTAGPRIEEAPPVGKRGGVGREVHDQICALEATE